MSQISKDIIDELNGHRGTSKNEECYTTGKTKTINFVKADGSKQMFPYSQLITAWTEHTDEENVIKIFYSTHLVTFKGYNLDTIYEAIDKQNLKSLTAQDDRYFNLSNEKKVFVKGIEIEWKKATQQAFSKK